MGQMSDPMGFSFFLMKTQKFFFVEIYIPSTVGGSYEKKVCVCMFVSFRVKDRVSETSALPGKIQGAEGNSF